MNIGLYQSAASLSALERWQDAVAQNITSSQVPGYKKRTVEFSAIAMGETQPADGRKVGQGEGLPGLFPRADYGLNFQPGEVNPTKRDLDVALQGVGFFQVQMPDGSRGYTRAGSLHIRPDRTLVAGDNYPILSTSGNPITLQPQGGEISISQEGAITQGANQLGTLSVVKFADNAKLVPVAGGVFLPPQGYEPTPVANPVVLQGQIEGSNVTPLREMVALVQIARAYEANQKVLSTQDQTLARALESLG